MSGSVTCTSNVGAIIEMNGVDNALGSGRTMKYPSPKSLYIKTGSWPVVVTSTIVKPWK